MKQSHNVKIEVDQYYVGDEGKMKKSSFVKKKWGFIRTKGSKLCSNLKGFGTSKKT